MITLKIISIIVELILAGMVGVAIGACIGLNKKYNRMVELLIATTDYCKEVIDNSKELNDINKKVLTLNELSINKIDNNVNFIKENMIRRKNPIKD